MQLEAQGDAQADLAPKQKLGLVWAGIDHLRHQYEQSLVILLRGDPSEVPKLQGTIGGHCNDQVVVEAPLPFDLGQELSHPTAIGWHGFRGTPPEIQPEQVTGCRVLSVAEERRIVLLLVEGILPTRRYPNLPRPEKLYRTRPRNAPCHSNLPRQASGNYN